MLVWFKLVFKVLCVCAKNWTFMYNCTSQLSEKKKSVAEKNAYINLF